MFAACEKCVCSSISGLLSLKFPQVLLAFHGHDALSRFKWWLVKQQQELEEKERQRKQPDKKSSQRTPTKRSKRRKAEVDDAESGDDVDDEDEGCVLEVKRREESIFVPIVELPCYERLLDV